MNDIDEIYKKVIYEVKTKFIFEEYPSRFYFATREYAERYLDTLDNGEIRIVELESNEPIKLILDKLSGKEGEVSMLGTSWENCGVTRKYIDDPTEKKANVYETNETMKLLGEQLIPTKDEQERIIEVVTAYFINNADKAQIYNLANDLFNLGKIYGINQERKRRNEE